MSKTRRHSVQPNLLRPVQAAEFLQISESSLRRLVQKGLLPVVRLGGEYRSAIAFRVEDLRAFADSRVEKVRP